MPGCSAAVRAAGHNVTALEIPIDETNFESVLASYARCYDVDASAFDVVISTKAPTYMVRHPRHVSYCFIRCACSTTGSRRNSARRARR